MSRYFPPEWAPQSAVMLTWPRQDGDFADHFNEVEGNFVEIAVTISRFQDVHINFDGAPAELRDRLIQLGAHPVRDLMSCWSSLYMSLLAHLCRL